MGHTSWAVEYPVDPSAISGGRLPVVVKLLSSLESALCDVPVEEWEFEVGGEPVAGSGEFRERLAGAVSVGESEFMARAAGIVVRSV